jgi:amidophosphoribosyltransferase
MDWSFDDKPKEECGVLGIFAPGRDVARLTFFGLYALQHRGQESAGIVTADGSTAYAHKNMGLVAQVFNESNLRPLEGHLSIGHNRYSTTGSSHVRNAGPYLIETAYGPLGVAHNGNITNALHLRYQLLQRGVGLSTTTDSEVITQLLAAPVSVLDELRGRLAAELEVHTGTIREPGVTDFGVMSNGMPITEHGLTARLMTLMHVAQGAYSLTVLTREALYAARDPLGLRPLCLGRLDEGWVIASESCALSTIGAELVRELEPGEVMKIDHDGPRSTFGKQLPRRALCVFEYVYFARPDSTLEGQMVHQVRQRMGRQLAREAPVEADLVIGVPDSATPAAIGFSLESGIPYSEGLTKNRYIGRTFIQPDDNLRRQSVHLKYNALLANLKGKRVVLVDDSIVRGNTAGPLVQMVREGGASEVHVRVSSPPVRHPCFMGIDMATYSQLIAHNLDIPAIQARIGADSLAYLSLKGLDAAVTEQDGTQAPVHCSACFSGQYPIEVPEWLFAEDREKLIFEGTIGN